METWGQRRSCPLGEVKQGQYPGQGLAAGGPIDLPCPLVSHMEALQSGLLREGS